MVLLSLSYTTPPCDDFFDQYRHIGSNVVQFTEAKCCLGLLNDWFGLPWHGMAWFDKLVFSIDRLELFSVVKPQTNPVESSVFQSKTGLPMVVMYPKIIKVLVQFNEVQQVQFNEVQQVQLNEVQQLQFNEVQQVQFNEVQQKTM